MVIQSPYAGRFFNLLDRKVYELVIPHYAWLGLEDSSSESRIITVACTITIHSLGT